MKRGFIIIAASACLFFPTLANADFSNPQNFDNGQQLLDINNGLGQLNWLMSIAIGVALFIAFSTRFRQ